LQSVIGQPMTRDGLTALLARMISGPDDQFRRRKLGRFERFMEGTRRPELQPFLNALQAAAMKSAGLRAQTPCDRGAKCLCGVDVGEHV
jgi:hypothetical protein